MKSFKLEKGESSNSAIMQAGVFLALIGLPVLFISGLVGLAMIGLGVILALGGKFAS